MTPPTRAPRIECVLGSVSVPRADHLSAPELAAEVERALAALLAAVPVAAGPGARWEVPGGTVRVPAGADRAEVARSIARYIHAHLSEGGTLP